MKTTMKYLNVIALMAMVIFSSCSSDDNGGGTGDDDDDSGTVVTKYVVTASSGENDYIVSGDDIAEDYTFDATSVDAVQSPGDRIWSFYKDEVLYGFLYNQADAGTTASYILNGDGTISKRNELALNVSIHIREEVGDQLILGYSDRLRDTTIAQQAYFYKVNPATDASQEFTLVIDDLLEEGEIAYFTDIAEYEGKIIGGARSINSSGFTSDFYNNTYVVVFNDDFTVDQVIKDAGRTGFVAGQKYSQGDTGLEVVENGDLYVFSSGQTSYADADAITVPSGVLKINQGTYEFDGDYFFNITEASGGHNLFRTYYMGGTTFILAMYPGTNSNATFGVDADRFAVVDVAAETFEWVSNFPENALVGWEFRTPYVDEENGMLIVTATPAENEHYLYAIDPVTAEATQLSGVVGESVKIVGKLKTEVE
nr:DUF4374 domain-containing protein [Allomuricauda sp.]